MPFHRGAALTTSTTLGFSDNADRGPSAGNGFYRRWPDDLAALQEAGITDLRLTLDWARLQPKPGQLDADWLDRFEQMVSASTAIGLRTWVTLHDGSIPKWFDNEGGFDDADGFARWWPRWVEVAADRFGDTVHGWVPFAELPAGATAGPWRDTWTILEGVHPVIASIDADTTAVSALDGRTDAVGLSLPVEWSTDSDIDDRILESAAERWGRLIRDTADQIDTAAIMITGFDPRHGDAEAAGRIVAQLVESVDDGIGDGVAVEVCFIAPAIAGAESPVGLLDQDRSPTPVSAAFLHL